MGSKIITFRVPDDIYDEFGNKCESEGHTSSEKLREFVDDYLYPTKGEEKPEETSERGEGLNAELEALTMRVEALEEMKDVLQGYIQRVEALEANSIVKPVAEAIAKPEAKQVIPEEEKKGSEKKGGFIANLVFKENEPKE